MDLRLLFSIFFVSFVAAQNNAPSPCPRLFAYEDESRQPGKWFGILTLVSTTDARGAWVRFVFDRPPLELGNWYGNVTAVSSKVYFIINLEDELKAFVPKTIRFYVTYNRGEPPPNVVSFRVNEKQACPEERITGTTNVSLVLKVGRYMGMKPTLPTPATTTLTSDIPAFPIYPGPASSEDDDDDVFVSDLDQFLNPHGTADQLNDEDKICGTVLPPAKPLITHGQPTYEGEFPWHVAIYYIKGIDLTYICGGSLISRNFMITVAHCVTKPRTTRTQNPERFTVYLGKYYLTRFTNAGIQDKQISEIIVHPGYNPHNYSNDVSLMKFESPVEYSDYVRPVCLWQGSTDLSSIVNKHGSVVGWGFDQTGKVTEKLMQAVMPIVSKETCIFSYAEFYSRFVSHTTYCAGFRNGTSVCNGDSGGGMVFPRSNSNAKNPVWQLRGLVSISAALRYRFKCDASNYVVFTDTAQYLDWIKNLMKNK